MRRARREKRTLGVLEEEGAVLGGLSRDLEGELEVEVKRLFIDL